MDRPWNVYSIALHCVILSVQYYSLVGQPNPKFGGESQVQDEAHIKQHLEGQVNIDESKMTPEQLQFHYFKLHDTDNDNMLDGIEIAKAIMHYHDENGQPALTVDENELELMIDSVLKDQDLNNDGYVDYTEFVKRREPPPPPPPH